MPDLVLPPPAALKHVLRHILVKEMDGGCSSVPVVFSPMICLTLRGRAILIDSQGQEIIVPPYILQGPSPTPQRVYYHGKTLLISVSFCTGMLQQSTGITMARILNAYHPLETLFDPEACDKLKVSTSDLLTEHQARYGNDAAATPALLAAILDLFQIFLLHVLKPAASLNFARDLVAARERLYIPLAQLAGFFGIGERQLERRLLKVFGFSLRDIRRIARFGHCMPLLLKQGQGWGDLTQIAHEAGYYDQAHMYRDFLDLAGVTPAQLMQHVVSKNPEYWLYQIASPDFENLFLHD